MAKDEPVAGQPASPADGGGDQEGGLPERVSEDLGGVQGAAPPEDDGTDTAASPDKGAPRDEPAPDAGEIEWAGQVVKKPPATIGG